MVETKKVEEKKVIKADVKSETPQESQKLNSDGKKIAYRMKKAGKDLAGNPIWRKSDEVLREY